VVMMLDKCRYCYIDLDITKLKDHLYMICPVVNSISTYIPNQYDFQYNQYLPENLLVVDVTTTTDQSFGILHSESSDIPISNYSENYNPEILELLDEACRKHNMVEQFHEKLNCLKMNGVYNIEIFNSLSKEFLEQIGFPLFLYQTMMITQSNIVKKKNRDSDEWNIVEMIQKIQLFAEQNNLDESTIIPISQREIFCAVCGTNLVLNRPGNLHNLQQHIKGRTQSLSNHMKKLNDKLLIQKSNEEMKSNLEQQHGTTFCYCLKPVIIEKELTDMIHRKKTLLCKFCLYSTDLTNLPKSLTTETN